MQIQTISWCFSTELHKSCEYDFQAHKPFFVSFSVLGNFDMTVNSQRELIPLGRFPAEKKNGATASCPVLAR